jgi:glycosyltransferase involved in cell wall biosynthesis
VFVPKSFPADEANASGSVTYEFDETLTIPSQDLACLNAQDFYAELTPDVAAIINAHFDVAFFGFFPSQLQALARNFRGGLVMRPFGLPGTSYGDVTSDVLGRFFLRKLESMEHRFWFGQGYQKLSEVEQGIYRRRAVHLPVALPMRTSKLTWTGGDAKILFVCPRIRTSPYYEAIYRDFKAKFGDMPHVIGGAQPVAVRDPNVAGFLSRASYEALMQDARVMYYHSRETHHLHYHPLEAVQAGMPLIFMAGGMLDDLGGKDLPGRCESIAEARSKIARVLANDKALIDSILQTQRRLLVSFEHDACADVWRDGMRRIEAESALNGAQTLNRKKRIAVIVPIGYRGGSLRGAKLLAQSIEAGAREAGECVEVVFAHLDGETYDAAVFDDLPATIKRRPFKWRRMSRAEALRAATYAGFAGPLHQPTYMMPDDGIQQFMDCDLLVIVSDRLELPLLPVRPYVLMIYDYLQRYEDFLPEASKAAVVQRAHDAEAIMITTDFTRADAIQFAGLSSARVRRVPMVAPNFSTEAAGADRARARSDYFIWTTNLALHKNHENAFNALRLYYEKHGGQLACRITGAGVESMLGNGSIPRLQAVQTIVSSSPALKRKVTLLGELEEDRYRSVLAGAAWLWHAARMDNGTFSVVEAAHLGVPSLASDYPAMREIDARYGLGLSWMDPWDPRDMARQLKAMEDDGEARRDRLPAPSELNRLSADRMAGEYWRVIRDYL